LKLRKPKNFQKPCKLLANVWRANTPTIVVAEDSETSMQADMLAENNEPQLAMQMSSRKAEAVPSSIAIEEPIITSKTKTKLVSGLMVVDYSESYTQEKSGATLSGTPAKYRTLADTTQEKNHPFRSTTNVYLR
jgi:hypothetical protein